LHTLDLHTRPLVDLHAHILPGVDDGPRTDEQALAMLRIAVDDDIRKIVATPHAHYATPVLVRDATARLQMLASDEGLEITILAGSEVRIQPEIARSWQEGRILTLAGTSWLLLEMHLSYDWPVELVVQAVERMQAAGLRPVLAHPERHRFVQFEPRAIEPIVALGVPVQLNAESLVRPGMGRERETAERLLRRRLAHLIASDAHSPNWRPPRIRAALVRASEIAGPEYANWMADNAETIVRGDDIQLPASIGVETRSRPL
jgi:protein-tyrosine phosphatase